MPLKPIRSREVVPVGEFKAHAAKWLKHVRESGQPVMVTQNGRVAAILISPQEYDNMVDREAYHAAIREGLADAKAGRVHDHKDVVKYFEKKYGPLPKVDLSEFDG